MTNKTQYMYLSYTRNLIFIFISCVPETVESFHHSNFILISKGLITFCGVR